MQRHFVTIRPDASLRQLVAVLAYYGLGRIDVVDGGKHAIGTASVAALFQLAAEETGAAPFAIPREPAWYELSQVARPGMGAGACEAVRPALDALAGHVLDEWRVADVVEPVTICFQPGATTAEVAYGLLRAGVERAPVIEDGAMAGVVSLTDVLRALARPGHARSWEPDEPYKVPVDAMP
jgi:CBS domain-containing protein